jgi:hypothetical protein
LIEEIWDAVGISAPNQDRNRINDKSEVILRSRDFVRGLSPKLANARDQLTVKPSVIAILPSFFLRTFSLASIGDIRLAAC